MGLIGSIVGGVTGAVGGVAAAKALNKGYRQQQEIYNNRLNDVRAHRDAVYYQDPTQSAENQAAVTNAQKVMDEAKQAVQGQSRKDNAWSSADSQIDTFSKYLADSKLAQAAGKAQGIQQAAGGLASAANSLPW